MVGNIIYQLLSKGANCITVFGTRIYHDHVRQGIAMPAATWVVVGSIPEMTMAGPIDLMRQIVTITGWADSHQAASDAATAIQKDVDGAYGTYGGLVLRLAWLIDKSDDVEGPIPVGSQDYRWGVSQDYQFAYLQGL